MRFVNGSAYLVAGVVAGISSAIWAIDYFGAVAAAPGSIWQSWDFAGQNGANPYSLAHYLISGRLPPATGQMREFSAQHSSDGALLTDSCDYRLLADPAPDGWWSMATFALGKPGVASGALITSDSVINESDGSVRITVASRPAGGNWVRAPLGGAFSILFTVAASTPSQSVPSAPLFVIERSGC